MAPSSDQLPLSLKGAKPTKDMLLTLLSGHIGRERGVTAAYCAGALATNPRVVRDLVTQLRNDGRAVCGHPATGYFMAKTAADIEATCAFLRARAMHSLALEAALRRSTLADLIGQLRFKT